MFCELHKNHRVVHVSANFSFGFGFSLSESKGSNEHRSSKKHWLSLGFPLGGRFFEHEIKLYFDPAVDDILALFRDSSGAFQLVKEIRHS